MKKSQQQRQLHLLTVILMVVCVLAFLLPHPGGHAVPLAFVLFVPVIFGMLERLRLRPRLREDAVLVPQAPVRHSLFQRPPPNF